MLMESLLSVFSFLFFNWRTLRGWPGVNLELSLPALKWICKRILLEVTFKIAEMALFTVLKHAAKGEKGRVSGRDDVIYLANQRDG